VRSTSFFDIALGAVILCIAVGFVAYLRIQTGIGGFSAYPIRAEMAQVDSLKDGSDVRISGVKVGTITGLSLKAGGYHVDVAMDIRQGIPIPVDSQLSVTSGVMSSPYLNIRPGRSKTVVAPGAMLHAS
jgi:phospholipid/cholesterol/gamma-HCH transport system substrate-binding protein